MRTNKVNSFNISFDQEKKLLKVQKQNSDLYHLSAHIYQGQKKNVFTTRLFKAFFAKHIKVSIEGTPTDVLVKIRDLEKATGLHPKDIEQILKNNQGNLGELISNVVFSPIKQLQDGTLNLRLGKAIEDADQNLLYLTAKKGKLKVFEQKNTLGSGSYKDVYRVTQLYHHTPKTLAYAKAQEDSKEARAETKREFKVGKKLYDSYKSSNPTANIPFLKYYSLVNQSKGHSKKVGILMEAGDTDLSKMRRRLRLSDKQKNNIARELLQGIAFMHQKGLVHRDLKPSNILLKQDTNQQYHAKIADFGLACSIDDFHKRELLGTPTYLPPEYFDESISFRRLDPEKFDSWALGVTLYELYVGVPPPFRQAILERTNVIEAMSSPSVSKTLEQKAPDKVSDIIINLMQPNFKQRWTVERALAALDEKMADDSQPIGIVGRLRGLAGQVFGFTT